MKIVGIENEKVEIKISDCQFPIDTKYVEDRNWLNVYLSVDSKQGKWKTINPAITTSELVEHKDWFKRIIKRQNIDEEEIEISPNNLTIEEQIEEIKRRGYLRFISASSFTSALSKISDSKIEIQEYIDTKDIVGYINPQQMASSILKNKIDDDNYFLKRIIVFEIFIAQIRKEYSC